jgi:periplasmic copper chaperone A
LNVCVRIWTLLIVVGLALASCGRPAAEGIGAPVLEVVDPFTPQPAASDVAAAYLTITNFGEANDTLVGASTEVAERVELHQSVIQDGVARMQPVEAIAVPAAGEAVLERGGYHLMLINPKPLTEGDRYTLTLRFAKAGERNVEVAVTGLTGGEGHGDMHDK